MIKLNESPNARGYQTAVVDLAVIALSGLITDESRWGLWKAQIQKGRDKPAKIPCDAAGVPLKINQPETWLPFAGVSEAYGSGCFDGIGVHMKSLPSMVGIDVDKCLNPDGSIVADKDNLVTDFYNLGGFVEVSPSRTGLRQFLPGVTLDGFHENDGAGLEVYDSSSSRYLTVTGQVWPVGTDARPIKANQAGLEAFMTRWCKRRDDAPPPEFDANEFSGVQRSASEVLKLLKTYNKRGKVTRLLDGDISDYQGHSEADAALCFDAAYFCRDATVIDAILRGSKLMRPKWDEKRGRETYGALTIRNALKAQTRNFDVDKAAKTIEGEVVKADKEKFKAKGAANLEGGIDDLINHKTGRLKHDLYCLTEAVIRDKRLLGVVYWDSFAAMPMITRSFRDAFSDDTAPATVGRLIDCHLLAVTIWFAREWGVTLKPKEDWLVLKRWAQKVRRNPVKERLTELEAKWDGKPRLANVLTTYAKAKTMTDDGRDISDYVRAVCLRWFISVVARCMNPGCKVDTLLILEGSQGAKKSTFARISAEPLGDGYFRDGFHLGSGKDDRIALQNRAIVEWAELSGLGRKEAAEIKNFISQQVDPYRNVYGAIEQDHPRTAVFIGTTNDSRYLSDPTGGRRFWPVMVGRIDIDAFKADIEQIWGEAVALWRSGAKYWFDEDSKEDRRILRMAEAEQFRRVASGFWDDVAASLSERLINDELPLLDSALAAWRGNHFSVEQVRHWVGGGADGAAKIDDAAWVKVAKALRTAGWENVQINGRARWRLSVEARHELCEKFGVDAGPKKSLSVLAAEVAAAKALDAAKAGKGVKTQK